MDLAATIANCITVKAQFGTNYDDPNKLSIGFGINAKYARPMGVAITSIAINNPEIYLDFHILSSSIEQDDLERLKKLSAQFTNILITIYLVDDSFISHLPITKHIPLPMYYRLFMPFVLKGKDRVLYLDADVLCQNKIAELLYLDMKTYPAAVISDIEKTAIKQSKVLSLQSKAYFNSGVMLINVEQWLTKVVTEQVLAFFANSSIKVSYPDQDALNLILENNKIMLPRKWNYLLTNDNNDDIPNDVVFLHCTVSPKPWDITCIRNTQAYRCYYHYESLSLWSGLPLIPPSTHSDARRYAKRLISVWNIIPGIFWYCKYLKMKYSGKN